MRVPLLVHHVLLRLGVQAGAVGLLGTGVGGGEGGSWVVVVGAVAVGGFGGGDLGSHFAQDVVRVPLLPRRQRRHLQPVAARCHLHEVVEGSEPHVGVCLAVAAAGAQHRLVLLLADVMAHQHVVPIEKSARRHK